MPTENISAFRTQSPYEQQIEELKRRQQMADMLQQQALQPLESQVAPGGMVVPTSPVLGLAKMLQAYMGGKQLVDISKQKSAAEKGARSEALDYLRSFNPEQKTIGMGEAAVNQLPMPQVGNNGQVSYQAPSVTAMPNARPVASLDQPMQMQVGGPLNRQDQMRRSEEGILSDNPLVRALAQTKYEAANKTVNPMDYLGKFDPDKLTPESLKSLQADIAAGRTPDVGGLTFIKKPIEPKTPLTSPLAKLLADRDALLPGDPRIKFYDSAITNATRIPTDATKEKLNLDPDAITMAGTVVMADPSRIRDYASFGSEGQNIRTQINNVISKRLKDSGLKPEDLVKFRISAKNNAASSQKLTAQANAVDAFEGLARNNGERVLELISKLDQTGVPLTEGLLRSARNKLGSDDAAELQSVLTTFQTETSRILSNPNMTGVVSDSARHEVQDMVPGNMSSSQARRVINRIFTEMDVRKHYTQQANETALGRASSIDNMNQPAPIAVPQTPNPPPISKLREGQVTEFSNGQRWKLQNGKPVKVEVQ